MMHKIAPFIIKKAAETIQRKAEQQFGNQPQNKSFVKEGETVIDKTPKKGQQGKDTVGEYVDFEEIE